MTIRDTKKIQMNSMKKDPQKFSNSLSYKKNGLLCFDNISCSDLAKSFGTPLYCYSAKEIRNNLKIFKKSISPFQSSIFFAVKSNFNPLILGLLAEEGIGADVVSKGEIEMALSSGIKAENIVFSGVGKSESDLLFAIKKQIFQINVESYEEIEDILKIQQKNKNKKLNISLRVNPDVDADTHKKISTGKFEDKFGIPITRIRKIFDKFNHNDFFKINGLAVHIGSQITNIKPFDVAFRKLRELTIGLKSSGYQIDKLDLGGGIGIVYSNNNTIDYNEYQRVISKYFGDLNVKLLFEPGRSLVGSAGILISKIIRVKKGESNNFLIIDSGMNDLIRPSMYDAYHEILPVKKMKNKKKVFYNVVGPICETGDSFGRKRKIQILGKDDYVVICSVGAYGSSMSSYYNCRVPANEIFIDKKNVMPTKKMLHPKDLYLKI